MRLFQIIPLSNPQGSLLSTLILFLSLLSPSAKCSHNSFKEIMMTLKAMPSIAAYQLHFNYNNNISILKYIVSCTTEDLMPDLRNKI